MILSPFALLVPTTAYTIGAFCVMLGRVCTSRSHIGGSVMGNLTGKVAIVTGASRGTGYEIAKLFAAEGGRVVCAARTLNEGDHRLLTGSLVGTVAAIRDAGGEA